MSTHLYSKRKVCNLIFLGYKLIIRGEFSYVQALKTVGKNIKDFQKNKMESNHQYIDLRFENERLVVLIECKNDFNK